MKPFHATPVHQLCTLLHTDKKTGLSKEEVAKRLDQYGYNMLKRKKNRGVLKILLAQLNNPIVWLLALAAIFSFVFGEYIEGVAVIVVILINTLIGFFMEFHAQKSMMKLQDITKVHSRVIRNGIQESINSEELVPGDVLYLESGDLVTADARLFEVHNLAVKESALTGESNPVGKIEGDLSEDTLLADRRNMIYKGTLVTRGNGMALVVATGTETEFGKIAHLAHTSERAMAPLDEKLNGLSKKLLWMTVAITFVILVAGILQGKEVMIMIETAVALAVAAIPEGLPIIASVALARGMLRLADKNVIVKTLESVEALGETNVIFTDKTGTLTENEMHAVAIACTAGGAIHQTNLTLSHTLSDLEKKIIEIGVLCNDSTFDGEKGMGDPVEVALLRMSGFLDAAYLDSIRLRYERKDELPFDSGIKMMGTIDFDKERNQYQVSVKGATEEVLQRCSKICMDGVEQPLNSVEKWLQQVNEMASKGLRVISFAYKNAPEYPTGEEELYRFIHDLTFVGLVGFIDPVRSDIKQSLETCMKAGIKVVMVTGDHLETARNIALQIGMIREDEKDRVLNGKDLSTLLEDQPSGALEKKVFARLDPAQKLSLISLYQSKHWVVAMTGDGVNDAPSLKKADIGIAMGQRGTEAAKEVADLILKDDAFSSIVVAIQQGRAIFDNIRKFVVYLLACNLSEILVIGLAAFLNLPLLILPLQILFINLVTDVFPALALGVAKEEAGVMDQPPRSSSESILDRRSWRNIILQGIVITMVVLGVGVWSSQLGFTDKETNNITFYTLILAQLWNVFNLTGPGEPFFKNSVTGNKYIWGALALCLVIVLGSYATPMVRESLELTPLSILQIAMVTGASTVPLILLKSMNRAGRLWGLGKRVG